MKRKPPAENTVLVLALAAAFFGGFAALAHAAGVFEKLSADEVTLLALFAAGYVLLTYACDAQVRATVDRAIASLRGRSAPRDRTRGRPANIRTRSAS